MKLLNEKEIEHIYRNYLLKHFPAEEIKPLDRIVKMYRENHYAAYGMYEDEELSGYAFCTVAPGCNQVLLDYLAVLEDKRSTGVGGKILCQLREMFLNTPGENHGVDIAGILIETEDIDFAKDQKEREKRRRRNSFYEKNGAVITQVKSQIYGVNYRNWQLPVREILPEKKCLDNLQKIYHIMVPDEQYEKNVCLYHRVPDRR